MSIPHFDPSYPYEGFSDTEANEVICDYVCPVCRGNLIPYHIPGTWVNVIVCFDHGNVEQIGRVSKVSVAIQEEEAHHAFKDVIRNLSDLWGELIPKRQSVAQNLKDLGF
jgi:hypothetical protein